ncbi:MAG TPA: radical SAM protein [Candidatus Omnitrophica bacterium]|nr:radical SAM protein [Candidatus Omnitrophota bacterium]
MRALLVNPWIYDFAAYDLWSKPIGLLKVAQFLKTLGFDIDLIDCLDRFHPSLAGIKKPKNYSTRYYDGHYLAEVVDKPEAFRDIPRYYKRYGMPLDIFHSLLDKVKPPDIIFVSSGLTYWYPGAFHCIDILKKRFKVPVILGGVYATLCYEHAREFSGADYVHRGKIGTDTTFCLSRVDAKNGICPYFFGYSLYSDLKYVTMRTSKGCPFRCSYCGWYNLDEEYERCDSEDILEQIEYFNKEKNIENFSFYDDALLYESSLHFKKICNGLVERKIKANFHTPNALHCSFLDEETAYLMKRCGFPHPRLGFEGIDKKMLARSGAKTTCENFQKAMDNLLNAGYKAADVQVNILIGLPDQTVDEVNEAISFAAGKGVRICIEEYSPVPGSQDFKKSGLKKGDDPLFHNNTAYVYKRFRAKTQEIKDRLRHQAPLTRCS